MGPHVALKVIGFELKTLATEEADLDMGFKVLIQSLLGWESEPAESTWDWGLQMKSAVLGVIGLFQKLLSAFPTGVDEPVGPVGVEVAVQIAHDGKTHPAFFALERFVFEVD